MTLVNIERTARATAQNKCDTWNRMHPPGTTVVIGPVVNGPGLWEGRGETKGPAFVREGEPVVFIGSTILPLADLTPLVDRPEAIDFEKAADERSIAPAANAPAFDAAEAHRILAEFERSRDALRAAEADLILARESLGRLVDQFGAKTDSQALMVIGNRAISVYPSAGRRLVEVADCVVVLR